MNVRVAQRSPRGLTRPYGGERREEQIFARRANTRGTTIGCSTKGAPRVSTKGGYTFGRLPTVPLIHTSV
jgi:hypothetical protein